MKKALFLFCLLFVSCLWAKAQEPYHLLIPDEQNLRSLVEEHPYSVVFDDGYIVTIAQNSFLLESSRTKECVQLLINTNSLEIQKVVSPQGGIIYQYGMIPPGDSVVSRQIAQSFQPLMEESVRKLIARLSAIKTQKNRQRAGTISTGL